MMACYIVVRPYEKSGMFHNFWKAPHMRFRNLKKVKIERVNSTCCDLHEYWKENSLPELSKGRQTLPSAFERPG